MTVDVDAALHDHFAAARAAELPPGSWERLEARLAAPAAGDRRRRALLVGAAAAVLLVAGLAALVALDGDEDERIDAVDAPTSTTAPPDPSTVPTTAGSTPLDPTTSSSVPSAGERPATVALLVDRDADGLGDLAVMAADGSVRTLVAEDVDDPGAPEEGGAAGVISLDVAPDGVVYYERCCEPAVGAVHAYDPATDEDLGLVTYGEQPTVSPDGRSLAVSVQGLGIQVVDLASGEAEMIAPDDGAAAGLVVTDLAWSPDGATLAVERVRHAEDVEVAVDLVSVADGSSVPVGTGLALPEFLPDGRLVVGTGAEVSEADGVTATGLAVVDPETGTPEPRFGSLGITGIDASADGRWIVVTARGGAVRVFDGGDDLHDEGPWAGPSDGVIAAAW